MNDINKKKIKTIIIETLLESEDIPNYEAILKIEFSKFNLSLSDIKNPSSNESEYDLIKMMTDTKHLSDSINLYSAKIYVDKLYLDDVFISIDTSTNIILNLYSDLFYKKENRSFENKIMNAIQEHLDRFK